MSRALPFSFDAAERAGHLAPAVELQWSDRYLGRAIFRASGHADDGLAAERAALVYRPQNGELVQLKSSGTSISVQRRDGATLTVTAAWALLATAAIGGADVALTRAGSGLVDLWAIWVDNATAVKAMRSTDGGATWAAAVTVYTATAGNTIGTLLHGGEALIGIEERRPGLTSLLQFYMAGSAGTWGVYEANVDSGGQEVWGGGITTEAGTLAVFAVDIAETTSAGTVLVRTARVYDLDLLAYRGKLHVGVSGGVRWREPRPVFTTNGGLQLVTTVQIPRGSGDASDRVSLYPWVASPIDALHPLGPPQAIYAVEDPETAAVAYGGGALYIMAGGFLQRLIDSNAGVVTAGTVVPADLELSWSADGERLEAVGGGTLPAAATQLRARAGLRSTLIDVGIYWIGGRVASSRAGWSIAGYGVWGVLERELQQQSCELTTPAGDPMTPGKVLELIFKGLGFVYEEATGLGDSLHPATAAERVRWTLQYGQDYAGLVRTILRWVGCELVARVDADGVTPLVRIFRPENRFAQGAPAAAVPAVEFGAAGEHPALEVVSMDPELVTDVTIFPGGWDHQIPLAEPFDRQLVVNAGDAYGVTSTNGPATWALARALAAADAGYVLARPALEIELWDTVTITDGPAGLAAARRLASSVAMRAAPGVWEMRVGLGLI